MNVKRTITLLAVIVAALALLVGTAHAATGTTQVSAPGGTLNFNVDGSGTFDFSSTAPVDESWGADTWDIVTADWQKLRVHDVVCVGVVLDLPDGGDGNYGVHCAPFDYAITSPTIMDVTQDVTVQNFDLSTPGYSAFPLNSDWYGMTAPEPPLVGSIPNLDAYVGQTITGTLYVNSEAFAYYGDSWDTRGTLATILGSFGTTTNFGVGLAAASNLQSPVLFKVNVQPSASDCHVPKLRGLKLRAARVKLAQANCRLGHVRRVSTRPALRGRVLKQSRVVSKWLPRSSRVRVTVGK